MKEWIGFDLDGTISYHKIGEGIEHVGPPIPNMVKLLKTIIEKGDYEAKIFTARVHPNKSLERISMQKDMIHNWLKQNNLPKLDITCYKDDKMVAYFDDRAYRVERNIGLDIKKLELYGEIYEV